VTRNPGVAASVEADYRTEQEDALFHNLLAFALAVGETLALYLALSLVHRTPPLSGFVGSVPDTGLPYFTVVMLSRGPLQPLNFCLFAFGANLLAMRLWNLGREFRAFRHPFFAGIPPNPHGQVLFAEESRALPLDNVQRIARDYSGALPLVVRRIEAGSRRLADEGDAGQVHAVVRDVAQIDREAMDGRYSLIRYLIWLIPTIGFLGTVLGIGQAILGFTGVLTEVGRGGGEFQAQLQPVLSTVAGALGVAFDTTVLALFLSALIVALTSIVQSREEALLSSVDEFCTRHFVSRIAVTDMGTKHLAGVLQQSLLAVAQALVGQRQGRGEEEEGGVSVRDIAGMITAQSAALQKAAESLATSAERISKALEGRPRQP